MATVREITTYDLVELTDAIDHVPAGARGGVMEVRDDDSVMLEITEPNLDDVDRIIFAPLDRLRRIG